MIVSKKIFLAKIFESKSVFLYIIKRVFSQKIKMYYWPERKRNRLEKYDYSSMWYYFVTICTRWGISYFWEILNSEMILNNYGNISKTEILKTQELRNEITIDSFVIKMK